MYKEREWCTSNVLYKERKWCTSKHIHGLEPKAQWTTNYNINIKKWHHEPPRENIEENMETIWEFLR
jgi:hypothetical protein